MKFNLSIVSKKIKQNIEISFLFFSILITIFLTQIYNSQKKLTNQNYKNIINNIYFQKTSDHIFNQLKPKYKNIKHKVLKGETLEKILKNYSILDDEITKIKKKLSKSVNINNLKANQTIELIIRENKIKNISYFLFPVTKTEKIQLKRNFDEDLFEKKIIITNLNKKIIFKENRILQSFYSSATKSKIPANIILEFARIYGFQIDFQRDIRKRDSFQIMYEAFEDDNGKVHETGNIVFANLKLSGVQNALYYFDNKNNEGHYDKNGKSVKKALMKTPINGARLSSPFGMRKHPIDGFNKMHRGTDFAAPMGTPIMASGSGTIKKAGWCGGGGNCIKIRHNSTYETVYAHMSKFTNGIKVRQRVKQGQIIGYVGSTGKSTGPHLHYEVIVSGKKINSQLLKLPSGKVLKNKERKLFETSRIKIDVLKSEIIIGLK